MHRTPKSPSRFTKVALIAVASLGTLSLAACGDDNEKDVRSAVTNVVDAAKDAATDVKDATANALDSATETAIRNIATQQGEEQFTNSGNPLDDKGLTCTAKVADGLRKVDVSCIGTTKDGKPALLEGQTSELPTSAITSLAGEFTGTVDGKQVFQVKQLGGEDSTAGTATSGTA